MLITQDQRDFFDEIRTRRDSLASWLESNQSYSAQIQPLIDQVDGIGTNFLTVDPRDLEQVALGALEQGEGIAAQGGFTLPADYHKHKATLQGPEQSVMSDIADVYQQGSDAVSQEVATQAQAACKSAGIPAFVCEARAPHLSEIPWWVWTGGAIGLGAISLYVYAAWKLAPTAARIGAAVYAPEFLPVVNQVFPATTPAVQEALQARR